MILDINELRLALFQGTQYHVDLDTGLTVSQYLIEEGIVSLPENYLTLPMYSRAAVYQQYMDILFSEYQVKDICELAKYPRFTLYDRTRDDVDTQIRYLHCAFHFEEELEYTHSGLPDFNEFFKTITRKCAVAWCEENGFDWFEK